MSWFDRVKEFTDGPVKPALKPQDVVPEWMKPKPGVNLFADTPVASAQPKIKEVSPLTPDYDPETGEPRNPMYAKVKSMTPEQKREQVFVPTPKPTLFGSRIPSDAPYGRSMSSESFDDAGQGEGIFFDDEKEPAWGIPRIVEGLSERAVGTAQTLASVPGGIAEGAKNIVTGKTPLYIKPEGREVEGPGWTEDPWEAAKRLPESVWEGVKRVPDEVVELGAGMLQLGEAGTRYDPDYDIDPDHDKTAERIGEGLGTLPGAIIGSTVETVTNPEGTWRSGPITGLLDVWGAGAGLKVGAKAAAPLAAKAGDAAASVATARAASLRTKAAGFTDGATAKRAELAGVEEAVRGAEATAAKAANVSRKYALIMNTGRFAPGSVIAGRANKALQNLADVRTTAADVAKRANNQRYSLGRGAASLERSAARKGAAAARWDTAADAAKGLTRTREELQATKAALSAKRAGVLDAAAEGAGSLPDLRNAFGTRLQALKDARAQKAQIPADLEAAKAAVVEGAVSGADEAAMAAANERVARFQKRGEWVDDDIARLSDEVSGAKKAIDDIAELRFGDDLEVLPPGSTGMTATEAVEAMDKALESNRKYVAARDMLAKIPTYWVTIGGGAAFDMGKYLLQKAVQKKWSGVGPESLRKWLFTSREGRVPAAFLDMEKQLKREYRMRELAREDAAEVVPKSQQQALADVLSDSPTTLVDDLETPGRRAVGYGGFGDAPPRFGVNPSVAPTTLDEAAAILAGASPEVRAAIPEAARESVARAIEVGNKYGLEIRESMSDAAQRGRAATQPESAVGVSKPGFHPALLPDGYKAALDDLYSSAGKKDLREVLDAVSRLDYEATMAQLLRSVADDATLAMSPTQHAGKTQVLKGTRGATAFESEYVLVPSATKGGARPFGPLHGRYVKSDIITELRNQAALAEALTKSKGFLKYLNYWKAGKTAGSLPTHVKNVLTGALIMAPAAGISLANPLNAKYYGRALADLLQRGNTKSLRMAIVDGVLDAGFKADVATINMAPVGKAAGPVALIEQVVRFGGELFRLRSERRARVAGKRPELPSDGQLLEQAKSRLGPKADEDALNAFVAERRAAIQDEYVREPVRQAVAGAKELGKSVAKMPLELYGAEDNLFRLALYYKLLSKAAKAEGRTDIYSVSAKARQAAADAARKAFVDYENIPGLGQILRSPHAPVDATGKQWGTGGLFWGASQSFIAYPMQATPIVKSYLVNDPLKARVTLALHDYLAGKAYEGTGRTEESDRRVLRASGQRASMPARAAGLGALESEGQVLGVDLGFLQPAGKFAPDMSRESQIGTANTAFDYVNDALNLGGPGFIQGLKDVITNRDSFSGAPVRTGNDDWQNVKQTLGFLGRQALPPATPYIGPQTQKLALEPDYQGRVPTQEEAYLSVLGGINSRSTSPDDAVAQLMRRVGYSLTNGDSSDLSATTKELGYHSNYGALKDEQKTEVAARFMERNRGNLEDVLKTVRGLPESDEVYLSSEDLQSILDEEDPEFAVLMLQQLTGMYSSLLGQQKTEQKRTADDLGR